MATSSRKTALTALSEVTENEGYSNIVIDKAIRAAELSPRDAALASTIFYGVLEKRLTLDFYIRKFLAKPKQKLDGTVLNILRIAVYQMMYLDRVPDSAAVNEAVLCAAEYRRGQYKNFVTLAMLQQIGVEGVVTALHEVPNGEIWTLEAIEDLRDYIESFGLRWSVVESLPVCEAVKYGKHRIPQKFLPLVVAHLMAHLVGVGGVGQSYF